jgi:hypothetical protein
MRMVIKMPDSSMKIERKKEKPEFVVPRADSIEKLKHKLRRSL